MASVDVADVGHRLCARIPAHDSLGLRQGHHMLLLVPAVGYSQQTSGVAQLALDLAYRRARANVSTVISTAQYTLNHQLIFTAASSLWTASNRWNLVSDWRIMRYPQSTYGLGMRAAVMDEADIVSMDYKYFRLYQTAYRRLAGAWYGGLGYQLDYHWGIVSRNSRREVTTISHYSDGVSGNSVSSGPVLSLLYDNRPNAINPQGGCYFSAQYRPNLMALGSDTDYQSLLLEGRCYFHIVPGSPNLLALWSYNVLTLRGTPPFLDLPSTGWDTYGNVGRGFIQGRFRGKNFLYGEAEYRFRITRNQLLGGVVFANAQSVTELEAETVRRQMVLTDSGFEKVVPGLGTGLRLNLNKNSRTNLAVDYGIGLDGSHGVSLNLGEVF